MGLLKWLLLWSLVVCQALSALATGLTVGKNEPECEYKNDVLYCDYKNANQDIVNMNSIPDDTLKKVFLYNINKLYLIESVCVSVALHNVKEVLIKEGEGAKCEKSVELSAKKCNLDRIPGQITVLYLEESVLESLETDAEFSKLNVISSNIKMLNMTTSFVSGTKAVIQDSRISTLQKMIIDSDASLLIMKSTINTVNDNSLEIIKGNVTMKDSTITGPERSISLGPRGVLTVGNQQGEMTVTGWSSSRNIEKLTNTGKSSSFLVPFVICLILLLISWIVMVLMAIHFRKTLLNLMSKNKEVFIDGSVSEVTQKLLRVTLKNDGEDGDDGGEGSSKEKDKQVAKELTKETERKQLITRQIKDERKKYEKNCADINTKMNSDKSKENILYLFDKVLAGYKFLGFLQGEETTVIGCLVQARWDITENKNDKAIAGIKVLNCSEETVKTYQSMFKNHEDDLNKIISLLTTAHAKEVYKKDYQMENHIVDCFKELAELIGKGTSKKKEALRYCAQKIIENNQAIKNGVLDLFDKELIARIERTEKIIEYLTAEHPQTNPGVHETKALEEDKDSDRTAEKPDNDSTTLKTTKNEQPNPNLSQHAV